MHVDVDFTVPLSQHSCARLAADFLKYILFARQQVPCPVDDILTWWSERLAKIEREASAASLQASAAAGGGDSEARGVRPRQRHRRLKAGPEKRLAKFAQHISELIDGLPHLFASPVHTFLVLLGPNSLHPREIYCLRFAGLASHSEWHTPEPPSKLNAISRKFLRALMLGGADLFVTTRQLMRISIVTSLPTQCDDGLPCGFVAKPKLALHRWLNGTEVASTVHPPDTSSTSSLTAAQPPHKRRHRQKRTQPRVCTVNVTAAPHPTPTSTETHTAPAASSSEHASSARTTTALPPVTPSAVAVSLVGAHSGVHASEHPAPNVVAGGGGGRFCGCWGGRRASHAPYSTALLVSDTDVTDSEVDTGKARGVPVSSVGLDCVSTTDAEGYASGGGGGVAPLRWQQWHRAIVGSKRGAEVLNAATP